LGRGIAEGVHDSSLSFSALSLVFASTASNRAKLANSAHGSEKLGLHFRNHSILGEHHDLRFGGFTLITRAGLVEAISL
jgi:hypothetical protein